MGVANTALDLGLFSALTFAAHFPAPLANVVSYSSGIALSFSLNRAWTFRDRAARGSSRQLAIFVMGNLVGLALTTAIIALLLTYIGPLAAKIVSVAASFLWNFVFANRIVFRK